MTHSDAVRPGTAGRVEPLGDSGAAGSAGALTAAVRRTLDDVAQALDVTLALLGTCPDPTPTGDADDARLAEAAALLQAFVRIAAPEARRRCIAFVRDVAEAGRT